MIKRSVALLLGLFFLAALLFLGYSKAHAAPEPDYSTDETMPPFVLPSWADPSTTWEPYATPGPSVTPGPGSLQPSNIYDLAQTSIYARLLWFSQGANGGNISYNYITMSNTFAGSSLAPIRFWTAANSSYLQEDEDGEPDYFLYTRTIGDSFPYNGIFKSISNCGYLLSVADFPVTELHNGYKVSYTFSGSNLAPTLRGTETWMEDIGINDLFLRSLLQVQVISRIIYTDNTSTFQTVGSVSWDDFVNGYTFDIEFSPAAPNVRRIDLNVIVNPSLSLFPILDKVNAYLEAHPDTLRPSLNWGFGIGTFQMQRTVTLTEQEYNRNWFQNLFIPDPDALREKIELAGVINDNSGLSTFVMGLRDLFLSGISQNVRPNFPITLPGFSFPINGQTVTFWESYNFDWGAFLYAEENTQLRTLLRIFTNFLFVSAFANSLVSVFVAFWDTHLYNGVNGGGEED